MISHSDTHKERTQVARDWRSKRAEKRKKTTGLFILFYCAFCQSWHANAVLQMKIPLASRYNVPRGGWEFAFTGLGGWTQIWSPWQLEPPTLTLCADPWIVPDVIPRGNSTDSSRLTHHAKANMVGWVHIHRCTCANSLRTELSLFYTHTHMQWSYTLLTILTWSNNFLILNSRISRCRTLSEKHLDKIKSDFKLIFIYFFLL